jgi:hypothetical protein
MALLEFEKGSNELKEFRALLKFIETDLYEYDENGYLDRNDIYQYHDGRYFIVNCDKTGEFKYHRREYKKDNPYITIFQEVEPIEIVIKKWEIR